jgi:hypothetical protein
MFSAESPLQEWINEGLPDGKSSDRMYKLAGSPI